MDEEFDIKKVLSEISADLKTLKTQTSKNHESLKTDFTAFKNNINSQLKALDGAVKSTNACIDDVKTNVRSIKESQEFISARYDSMEKEITSLKSSNGELEKENEYLNQQVKSLFSDLQENKNAVNDLSQYIRRTMVELNGIPRYDEEDINDVLEKVFTLLECEDLIGKVDVAHRLSKQNNAGIIIKFVSRNARDQFYSHRKKLKDKRVNDLGVDFSEFDNKFYINESLTKKNRNLFKATRKKCKEKDYESFWTANGIVYVKKNSEGKVIKICSDNDVSRLIV